MNNRKTVMPTKEDNPMRFCIILGAMKAGTTSLFTYLSQHPDIAPSSLKEPSFFSDHYEKGIKHYLKLWNKEDVQTKILMEASTNYTKHAILPRPSQNLFDFTKLYNVDVKFIYIMRNPIDRVESQYTYSYARWTDESLEHELEHGHLIDVSRYAHQLDFYYDKFDRAKFLLLDFDDLINRPDEILRQVCEFLNIDATFHFSDLNRKHNQSKGKVITKPIEKMYKKYPLIKSFAEMFPKSFKMYLSKILLRQKIPENFRLSKAQRQRVYDALEDDMVRLREKYGVDVSKWGF